MNDRARQMHAEGTWHLSYFQAGEFGTQVKSIDAPRQSLSEKELWKDQIGFLREKIADGIWRDWQGKESYEGWYLGVIMDPAGPHYPAFLLEQARRYVEKVPDSDGLGVDRLSWSSKEPGDWVKPVNWGADDGLGWYEGWRGRHFSVSWKSFLAGIGPIMHQAGKVIFVNPITGYRLDFMRHVDGFYDEVLRVGPPAALNEPGRWRSASPGRSGPATPVGSSRTPMCIFSATCTWGCIRRRPSRRMTIRSGRIPGRISNTWTTARCSTPSAARNGCSNRTVSRLTEARPRQTCSRSPVVGSRR